MGGGIRIRYARREPCKARGFTPFPFARRGTSFSFPQRCPGRDRKLIPPLQPAFTGAWGNPSHTRMESGWLRHRNNTPALQAADMDDVGVRVLNPRKYGFTTPGGERRTKKERKET